MGKEVEGHNQCRLVLSILDVCFRDKWPILEKKN